eukprot:2812678-Pleurochrysis_carterae.AAC.1
MASLVRSLPSAHASTHDHARRHAREGERKSREWDIKGVGGDGSCLVGTKVEPIEEQDCVKDARDPRSEWARQRGERRGLGYGRGGEVQRVKEKKGLRRRDRETRSSGKRSNGNAESDGVWKMYQLHMREQAACCSLNAGERRKEASVWIRTY